MGNATQKIYLRSGINQKLYGTFYDVGQPVPSIPLELKDGDGFIPKIQGEAAPIYFRHSQFDPIPINDPVIKYVSSTVEFCCEIPSDLISTYGYGTGTLVIIDDGIYPVYIDFEVVHEYDYGSTFDQVATLSEGEADNIKHALDSYEILTQALLEESLNTLGIATSEDITGSIGELASQISVDALQTSLTSIQTNTSNIPTSTVIRGVVDAGLAAFAPPSFIQMQAAFSEIKGAGWTDQSLVGIYANLPSLAAIQSQFVLSLGTYGAAKTTDITSAASPLAKSTDLTTANSGISTLLTRTSDITLTNINTQVGLALINSGIPNTLSTINTGVTTIQGAISAINVATIVYDVWHAAERSLTTSPTGEGISVADIAIGVWANPDRIVTGIPAGLALSSDMQTVLSLLPQIKVKTDVISTKEEIVAAVLADPVLFRVLKIWAYGSTTGLVNGIGTWTVTYENDKITGTRDSNGNDSNIVITLV